MKKQIREIIRQKLTASNYIELVNFNKKKNFLFYKELDNGMILTLALEESRLYSHKITCSFYLAISYSWPMTSPTFLPDTAYQRIGAYLNVSDRKELVKNKEYWYSSAVWWESDSIEEITKLIKAIGRGEKKIISDKQYVLHNLQNISKYKDYIVYINILYKVLKNLPEKVSMYNEFDESIINSIFIDLTKKIVKEENDIRNNKDGILFLSLDAWRCYFLSSENNVRLIGETAKLLVK